METGKCIEETRAEEKTTNGSSTQRENSAGPFKNVYEFSENGRFTELQNIQMNKNGRPR